jgi:membrane fusion protein (multidrug efflux system)
VVPNPDKLLMPGMYVRAVLQEGVNAAALLVPQQAVTRAPDGSASALVVDADNKVAKRPISVGRAVGTRWQVLDGLAAGDRVMTEGSQRVKVGDKVKVVDLGAKPASAAPGPVASAEPDAASDCRPPRGALRPPPWRSSSSTDPSSRGCSPSSSCSRA